MYRHGFLLAIMFCLSQNVVVAYPSGAPTTACDSMTPGHGTPSNVACPFVTIFDKTEMFSNGTLKVTLQAPTSITKTFKGFMVMGFDKATSAVIGTFKISSTDQQYSKTLDCSQYDNAATHKNDNTKSSISMDWIPPQGFGGDVEFKTTFLEDKDYNFWVKELSETIRITASEPLPTIPTTDSANTELPIPDPYVGCGETKGCIAIPDGCVANKTCSMMTTYKKFDNANLVLEVYGEITGDQYVAVGFSTDSEMGSDSVVECVQYRDTPKTYQSYNTPDHNNIRLTNLQVIEEMSSMSVDGYIYCSVKHPIVFKNSNQDFDLNQPHYIFMATGTTGKENIQRHSKKEKSSASINLTSDLGISYYKEKESRVLKQLHGSFMVIAWLMAASVGVLMPRYMKKTWVGKQFMKKDLWFVYHRGLMVLVWTLTVIGFIIIFIDVDGWVSESVSENPHPLIGCITTVLAFIQPFMALMRPMPNAPNRYIFNWAHMLVGYSAHILAITCIFLAVEMEEAELPYETYWILTAHICCYVGAHLLLTFLARRNLTVRDVFKDDAPRDETGSLGRKIIVSCYICIVVGLGSTVVAFIAGA
ncbi:putative ferric-chelate reductase 1 homolog [Daphnia pulicaria]|uniref:putative ferric-chelate reductase 1 homolog n=1 Tax=Daphnia pulicaria TaxID=35523 RepID=UPI001EEAC983|nr:putative ferric-chelate reductase 1 homolog [Daphnia pulicaria]